MLDQHILIPRRAESGRGLVLEEDEEGEVGGGLQGVGLELFRAPFL